VYYMPYPCEKLSAWWVVYKVNPRVWLHNPDDDELSCSFNIDPDSTLNFLLSDANDVTLPEERKHSLRKKEM
jgi:hypothetical protein